MLNAKKHGFLFVNLHLWIWHLAIIIIIQWIKHVQVFSFDLFSKRPNKTAHFVNTVEEVATSCATPTSLPLSRCPMLESNGGVPGILVEMVFHPGAARNDAVPPMRSRTRPGALLPAASGESDPRHGPETQRVSFVNKLIPRPDGEYQTWRSQQLQRARYR